MDPSEEKFWHFSKMSGHLNSFSYLPEFLDLLLWGDPMCCTLLLLTESNTHIVNLDSRFHCNLILFLFRCYTIQICWVWSCLVGISTDTADGNESLLMLLKLSGSGVQFVSQDSPGYSEAAKYCFLHRAGIALLGCLESPSTCGVGSHGQPAQSANSSLGWYWHEWCKPTWHSNLSWWRPSI